MTYTQAMAHATQALIATNLSYEDACRAVLAMIPKEYHVAAH